MIGHNNVIWKQQLDDQEHLSKFTFPVMNYSPLQV